MNPGYLSLLIICIMMILLASGWKEELVGGVSHKVLFLFFMSWIPLSLINITLFERYQVNMSYGLLLLIIFLILATRRSVFLIVHLLSIGLLMGSFYFLFKQLVNMNPIMVVYRPLLDQCVLISFLTVLFVRHPLQQLACLSIGLMTGDMLNHYFHQGHIPLNFGGAAFQDQWWLTLLMTRALSLVCICMFRGCRGAVRHWIDRKQGWRK